MRCALTAVALALATCPAIARAGDRETPAIRGAFAKNQSAADAVFPTGGEPSWLHAAERAEPADPPGFDSLRRATVARRWFDDGSVAIDEFTDPGAAPLVRFNGDDVVLAAFAPRLPSIISGRVRGELLDDSDDLARVGGRIILDTNWLVGIDTEAYHWRERRPLGGRNDFWTGDANLVARFGLGTPVRLESGLGVNWLDDGGETEFGFNTTYGLDIRAKQWLTLGGQLDWGRIGSREVFHGQITAGLMLGPLEFYAGYDWYKVGRIDREGPIVGLGLWF